MNRYRGETVSETAIFIHKLCLPGDRSVTAVSYTHLIGIKFHFHTVEKSLIAGNARGDFIQCQKHFFNVHHDSVRKDQGQIARNGILQRRYKIVAAEALFCGAAASLEISEGLNQYLAIAEHIAELGDVFAEMCIRDSLGTFSTDFSSSSSARATNLQVGAGKINGHVLMPGETLSGYECLQPFTAENGYKNAATYENGQVVDSIGGGVCPVSYTHLFCGAMARISPV